LYRGLTIEDLKKESYQSRTRNVLISEALYLTKDIEKYGSGLNRIREDIKTYPTMEFFIEEIGALGKADSTIKEHLAKLKKEGILQRIGSNKSGYWKVL